MSEDNKTTTKISTKPALDASTGPAVEAVGEALSSTEAVEDKAVEAAETVAKAVGSTVAPVAEAQVEAVKAVVAPIKPARATPAKAAPAAVKPEPAAPPAKRSYKPRVKRPAEPVIEAVRAVNRKAGETVSRRKYVRKPTTVAVPAAPTLTQGRKPMSYEVPNMFAAIPAVPGAEKVQSMFVEAGAKGQEALRKSQAFAESLTEAAKANVEAVVESTKIAAAGARELGQDVVATTKGNVESASAAVKTLAEAKSPTEFFQLQSELVRTSFDRLVADGSKFTEQVVKLTTDAIQPLSNRASVNAEKFSDLTA